MMRKIWLLVLVVLSMPQLVKAQVFANLDFEYGVYKAQPRKWAIEGEGETYTTHLDSVIYHSGNRSLSVSLKNSEIFIFLSIPGNVVAGKEIQIEGHFRSLDSDSLQAMLIFHNSGSGGTPIRSQPIDARVKDWQLISQRASLPNNYSSDRLLVALTATGTGQFWFDNVNIKIAGREYGNGPHDFREPSQKEIEALNRLAAPIYSLEPDADNRDLVALKKIVGNGSIIALGENSHGSSSIYKVKLRMMKNLIANEGFSVFALESPTVEADRINEYVLYGKGTLDQVINDLVYPSWQTAEMVDIIQWMKSYNETAEKKVQFRGFDMQNGLSALKAVEDFSNTYDPILLMNLRDVDKIYHLPVKDDDQWKLLVKKTEEINLYLSSKKYADIDSTLITTIKHYMDIFHQSLPSRHKTQKGKTRDEYMADNIDWIVKHSGRGAKVIVSADNTHITKASGKMGHSLYSWYGDKYLTFGFTYNTGTYSAYGPEKYYEVYPSFTGTYEHYFSKCNSKNFILDLRVTSNIDILDMTSGFRSIGSRPQQSTQFVEINLKDHFDVIVYIEKSMHTENFIR